MRDAEGEIEKRSARVTVIGTGAPSFIPAFREGSGFTGTILVDPDRRGYQAAGFVRSAAAMVHPKVVVAGLRAFRKGFRQGRTKGDPWQQGGVLVVRPDGAVAFRYASQYSGDHPATPAIVAAL